MILATKAHQQTSDPDTNYFTDADLAILGHRPDIYQLYCDQVREEYWMYADIIFKAERSAETFPGNEPHF